MALQGIEILSRTADGVEPARSELSDEMILSFAAERLSHHLLLTSF